MGWKDWPYWLKGGIIGLSIFMLFSLSAFMLFFLFPEEEPTPYDPNTVYTKPEPRVPSPLNKFFGSIFLGMTYTFGLPIVITALTTCSVFCKDFHLILISIVWFFLYILIGIGLGFIKGKTRGIKWIFILILLFLVIFSLFSIIIVLAFIELPKTVLMEKEVLPPSNLLYEEGNVYFFDFNDEVKAENAFEQFILIEREQGKFSEEGQKALLYLAVINKNKGDLVKGEKYYKDFLETNPDLESDYNLKSYQERYLKR